MSFSISTDSVTDEVHDLILKNCVHKKRKDNYNPTPGLVKCFAVDNDAGQVFLPLGLWRRFAEEFPNDVIRHSKVHTTCHKTMYTKETDPKKYRDQDVVVQEALQRLKNDRVVFLALPCGFGKTSIGNYLSSKLARKTLILCHVKVVLEQWVEEYQDNSTAKVQLVKGKTLDPSADVYVMGIRKATLMPEESFDDIGTVIVDEAHISTITCFTSALLRVRPRYLIGLSATPDRADGMHKILPSYFGPLKQFIIRKEVKDFTVFKVQTPFQPNIRYTFTPKGASVVDWNEVINSLAYNEKRQRWALKIVRNNPDAKIMILTDRNIEARALYDKLIEAGDDTDLLIENMRSSDWNHDCRVLVAGMKKAGVGFNDESRTILILMTDKTDVRQFEGRIRCVNNKVYDLVDDYRTLERHWSESREPWYRERGATIKTLGVKRSKETKIEAPTHTRFVKRVMIKNE